MNDEGAGRGRKKRGPKPRHPEGLRLLHLSLAPDVYAALNALGEGSRSILVEQALRAYPPVAAWLAHQEPG